MARYGWLLLWLCVTTGAVAAQSAGEDVAGSASETANDVPAANPGRPTVSTPATITPAGYFQFETGVMGAWTSPEFSSQFNVNEVINFSVSRWLELVAAAVPYEHAVSDGQTFNGTGGFGLGAQAVVHHGEGANPTVAVAYLGTVVDGNTPNLDIGSFRHAAVLLISADLKGFHVDNNYVFDMDEQAGVRRAEYGQTLSVSHALGRGFGLSGEIWHFTQPFLNSNCVGTLWAVNYNAKKNLVFDAGFNRGLTSTSTRWEVFAGFTYLLPRKVTLW